MKMVLGLTGGLVFALCTVAGIVLAVSPGEDFQWLSSSVGGLLIGEGGSEGENVPEANSVTFVNDGNIQFMQSGEIHSDAETIVSGDKGAVFAVMERNAGGAPGELYSILSMNDGITEGEGETPDEFGAALLTAAGNLVMGSGSKNGEDFVPHSTIVCTQAGDVIVKLGDVASSGSKARSVVSGEAAKSAGTEDAGRTVRTSRRDVAVGNAFAAAAAAAAQDLSDTEAATQAWGTGYTLRLRSLMHEE